MRRIIPSCLLACIAAVTIANTAFCANTTAWDKAMAKPVSVKIKEMLVPDAVALLLKDTGINFIIDPRVRDHTVTAILKNVSLSKALGEVTRAAGVTYRKESEKSLRIVAPSDLVASSVAKAPAAKQTPPEETVTATVTLNYVTPGDVAPVISKLGHLEAAASSGNKIVLVGDAEAVERAQEVIRMLDVPEALPRPVRIKLEATVVNRSPDNPDAKPRSFTVENTGAEGADIFLQGSIGTDDPSRRDSDPQFTLFATLKAIVPPNLAVDNQITITGQGVLAQESVGGEENNRILQIAAVTAPGEWVTVASGSSDSSVADTHTYEVKVLVTVEKGRLRTRPVEINKTTRQIDIMAEMFEIDSDKLADLGIDWNKGSRDTQVAVLSANQTEDLHKKLRKVEALILPSQITPMQGNIWALAGITPNYSKGKHYELRLVPRMNADKSIALTVGYIAPQKEQQMLKEAASIILSKSREDSTNKLLEIQLRSQLDTVSRSGNLTLNPEKMLL